jgi:hypothetical protein
MVDSVGSGLGEGFCSSISAHALDNGNDVVEKRKATAPTVTLTGIAITPKPMIRRESRIPSWSQQKEEKP